MCVVFQNSRVEIASIMAEKEAPDEDTVEGLFSIVIKKIGEYVQMTSDKVLKDEGKIYQSFTSYTWLKF